MNLARKNKKFTTNKLLPASRSITGNIEFSF